jgi:hypothetical protein
MQTMNFTCGHCGNLMAVGQEHLGQQVRCPHCQQVVQAPAPLPAPPPPAEAEAPAFTFTPSRDEESIFTPQEMHDDIFGEPKPPVLEMPPEPVVPSYPLPPATGSAPTEPPWAPPLAAPEPAWMESQNAATEPLPLAAPASAPVEPALEPTDALVPATEWSASAGSETGSAFTPEVAASPRERPAVRRSAQGSRFTATILIFLVPYAIFMTGIAIYYYYQMRLRDVHPLEMLPDVPSENPGATRKGGQVSSVYSRWKVDTALPAKLRVRLGKTIKVGELEVTPEKVERGKVVFCQEPAKYNPEPSTSDALILTLHLRNVSSDQQFYPTDPAFDAQWKQGKPEPYTYLEMGTERFFGGPIPWEKGGKKTSREYVQGQDNDNRPLGPHEQRTTVVCTDPANKAVLNALRNYRGPLLWRVRLRRGLVTVRDKEVSASAVVGVEFAANDIQKRLQ